MSSSGKEGFDRVFSHVGSNGPFQYTLLLIVSLQCIILSWHHLGYVFLGAVPDHWCRVPELESKSWTIEQIRNVTIPRKGNDDGWESCKLYDLDHTFLAQLEYDEAVHEVARNDNLLTKPCQHGWTFDKQSYESTLVTEFGIVCENRYLVATIQATYMAGVFLGSLVLGSLSDQVIGRRTSVLISVVLVQVGGVAAAFSSTYWQLILLRFFVAFGVAGAYQNCYVLLMEYSGTTSRSLLGMIQQLPFAIGYMLMALYAYLLRDWRSLQFAYSITAVILLSYFWILPESARWLAVSGNPEKSLHQLMKVAQRNKKNVKPEDIYGIVHACCESEAREPKPEVTFTISEAPSPRKGNHCHRWSGRVWHPAKRTIANYLSLVATPEMRKRTLVIWFLFITVDLVYYGVVFDSATLTNDPYLLVFLGGLSEVPAYTVVVPFLAKWGRRPTIVATFFLTSACTLSVACLSADATATRLILSMAGKLFITTCFAVIYLLGTELYPTSTRTTGLAAAVFMGRVGSIMAPFVVDGMKSFYKDLPNIIFAAVCLASVSVAYLIPETKDAKMADQLHDIEEELPQNRNSRVPAPRTASEEIHVKATVEESAHESA